MKKALFAVAAVALLAVTAQAGTVKLHSWPCTFTPQVITTIPVLMDVGYWVQVTNQDAKIKLSQESIHTYRGCTTLKFRTNTKVAVSAEIAGNGRLGPDTKYAVTIDSGSPVPMPGGEVKVCAEITNADLSGIAGGQNDQQVATVTIKVVPVT